MAGPSGTVTFLFTDIEGSTRLWQHDEAAMRSALSRHDELLCQAIAEHDGTVFSSMGDGMAAAFASASSAVAAALTRGLSETAPVGGIEAHIRGQVLARREPPPTGTTGTPLSSC